MPSLEKKISFIWQSTEITTNKKKNKMNVAVIYFNGVFVERI
jgi:hypothetical protein